MSDVMIEAKGLGKRYGGFVALQNASFELHRGEILGLLGPNGAGKSTTMRILTCFIAPTAGTAKVNGCDIWEDPLGVRRAIGYLPESTPLYGEMLVLEYLQWIAAMRGLRGETAQRRTLAVVEEVGLEDVIAKAIRELSKGFKQRVGLAQALIHEPPILILDEPMSGLDPIGRKEVRDLIVEQRQRGKTILFTSHILSDVEMLCDRVGIMQRGKMSHYGNLGELLRAETRRAEVDLEEVSPELLEELRELATELREVEGRVHLVVTGEEGAQPVIERAVAKRARVVAVTPARETLEDLFVRDALREDEARA